MSYSPQAFENVIRVRHQPPRGKSLVVREPVVVALDGNAAAEAALPHAVQLARRWNAPLQLVHVRNPVEDAHRASLSLVDDSESLSRQIRSAAYLKELAGRLSRFHDVPVSWDTPMGTSIESSLRAKCQTGAQALVMVRPRRSAASRFWWGSVTDRLIGRLTVPLLMVPDNGACTDRPAHSLRSGFSRVLAYLDGTETVEDVLNHVTSIASDDAVCHLLRVLPLASLYATGRGGFSPALDRRNQAWLELFSAKEKLAARGIIARPRLIFDGQTAAKAVVEHARAAQAQLIVLSASQHWLPWWLRDGVAEYVVRHAMIPVLMVAGDRRVGSQIVTQTESNHVDLHFN